MSMILKLSATTAIVGAGALVALQALQPNGYSPVQQNQLLAPLAGLMGVIGAGASTPAAAGQMDRTFAAKRVHLDKVVAQVELIVGPPGPMRVQAWGKPETMQALQAKIVGEELYVRLDKHEEDAWFPWNLFNMWSAERKPADLKLRVTAPSGTPYEMEEISGSIVAGDLEAPVSLEAHKIEARFGRVQRANVSIAGSGRVVFGPIREQLDIEVAGSGRFEAPFASAAQVEIAGGGEVILGTIAQGLDIEVAGSGDVTAQSINGPLDIKIAGSGDVVVNGGTATTFSVEIAGSGDVMFKGHANDPDVAIAGSGTVTVGSYSGNLDQDVIGSGNFIVLSKGAPTPAPPAPPPPPAQ